MLTKQSNIGECFQQIVAAVKAIASRGLSCRGITDCFRFIHDGNFVMALELTGEFDPLLAKHTSKYGNIGKVKPLTYIFNL
jgi:hypothetical protein